jgi:hypothetical protein
MALQFDDDSIRVISFAAVYLTITTKPYEPSKLRILNREKTRKEMPLPGESGEGVPSKRML